MELYERSNKFDTRLKKLIHANIQDLLIGLYKFISFSTLSRFDKVFFRLEFNPLICDFEANVCLL